MVNNRVEEVSAKYLVDHRSVESGASEGGCEANSVPVGYKQTEVGVIPEDWEIKLIQDVIDKERGIRYGIVQPGRYDNKGRLMVRGQDYSKGWVTEDEIFRVSDVIEARYRNARLRAGDLIITIVGAGTGHVEIVPPWLDGANLTQTTARMTIDCNLASAKFLQSALSTKTGQTLIGSFIKGNAQPGLNCGDIYGFRYASPADIKEQTAIANALSDVDALISNLESLIAKKQAIKTATMQQLLTGRTRLPEFALREDGSPKGYKQSELGEVPEDWEVRRVSEVLSGTQLGGNYANSESETEYPLIKMGNLNRGKISLGKIEYATVKPSKRDKVNFGDVLFNTRNTLELVGKIAIWRDELPRAYFNSNLMRLSFHQNLVCSNFYMNAVMNSQRFVSDLAGIATGTTSVAAIYTRDLLGLKLLISPKAEQTAIAAILSDMDQEIQTLEQRLNKTRQIKQGMMQQLLTGKIRLVKPRADTQ